MPNLIYVITQTKLFWKDTKGYYKFSIEREYHKHVDHGIVGAVLLFDLLMRRFKEMSDLEANGAIIVSEKKQYGKELEEHALKYANSISKHNMWFADKSTENQYREYGLDALIPKKDNSHRYVFSDDPLFFLLCILDSLEPIKLNDYNSDVLSNTEILVNNDTEQIIITLISSTINFYEKASTLESWMNLQVTPIADGCKIQIL